MKALKRQKQRMAAGLVVPTPPAEVCFSALLFNRFFFLCVCVCVQRLTSPWLCAVPLLFFQDPEGTFPYKCDPVTMDLGHVLHSNIVESSYFQDNCA